MRSLQNITSIKYPKNKQTNTAHCEKQKIKINKDYKSWNSEKTYPIGPEISGIGRSVS